MFNITNPAHFSSGILYLPWSCSCYIDVILQASVLSTVLHQLFSNRCQRKANIEFSDISFGNRVSPGLEPDCMSLHCNCQGNLGSVSFFLSLNVRVLMMKNQTKLLLLPLTRLSQITPNILERFFALPKLYNFRILKQFKIQYWIKNLDMTIILLFTDYIYSWWLLL